MRRLLFHTLLSGFAIVGVALFPAAAGAALKKQCKAQINVDAERSVWTPGGIVTSYRIGVAKRNAENAARTVWRDWAFATHGPAYADYKLAKNFKITCIAQAVPAKSVLCMARGFPCRADNAPPPRPVLNRIPSRNLNIGN